MKGFLPLFVALPLAGAFLIPLATKIKKWLGVLLANIVTASLLGLSVLGIMETFWGKIIVYQIGGHHPTLGIIFAFDSLSALIVLLIGLVAFSALLFSVRYTDKFTGVGKFYSLVMLLLAGMNGVALTGDLFNLFVFLEISAIASYALVSFGINDKELEAGFKYMVLGEVGGLFILLGIALLYSATGTLNMADLANTLTNLPKTPIVWFILGIFLFGFMIKSAVIPFHTWLPDAYQYAPASISALLAGVFSKVIGIYALVRITFNIFNLSPKTAPVFFNLLLYLGVGSLITGGFLALNQNNYKKILSYSCISQIGYIFVGLGIGNYWGITGALFFILAHALTKGLLFLTAGDVEHKLNTTDLAGIKGLRDRMPTTSWSLIIGLLSLSGVPPLPGFFAKLLIIIGALAAHLYLVAIICSLYSTLTLAYLLKIWQPIAGKSESTLGYPGRAAEIPTMTSAILFLVVVVIIFGIGFKPALTWIVEPAATALLRGIGYAKIILGG